MTIITCPFCAWSFAYSADNLARATRAHGEYMEHLATHR